LVQASDLLTVGIVGAAGSVAALIDLRTRRVPNPLTLSIAAAGLALAMAGLGAGALSQALLGLTTGLVLMLPGHLLGATGAGDVKLFAALGTVLGPIGIAWGFAYTAMAGGALAIVVALRRQALKETMGRTAELIRTAGATAADIEAPSRNNRFAYAPAIAFGTLLAALGL
jgi:prepilin peptidase CpaA